MGEVAFRVKPGSDLYNEYFTEQAERQKLHKFAREFFKKHGFCGKGGYYQRETLSMELTPEEHEKYASQLKKHPDSNGLYTFKKNSAMQQAWKNEVCANVNFNKMFLTAFWYSNIISAGSYALWARGNELYGLLESKYGEIEKLPDYMERIPLSQYYAIRDGE